MNIILDIGARNGESVEEFVRWPFDRIHAFEPMPHQYANLLGLAATDDRIRAHNFGLSDHTGEMTMYGDDARGEASVFATKVDLDPRTETVCRFVDVDEWMAANLTPEDTVYLKLNCEGSEVAILNRLLDTGRLATVAAFRVEFDISRVVGHEDESDELIARLDGYPLTIGSNARLTAQGLVDDIPSLGSHHDRLRGWLELAWPQ